MHATGRACSSVSCHCRYFLQNREWNKEELSYLSNVIDLISRIFQYIFILNIELSAYYLDVEINSPVSYTFFFFFLSASTAIPLSELLNKGSGAQFCHVLDFYFNSDNLERVIYANIVTISQKKWCCLINMNKSDAICSIPTLLSAERPFWLWTRTKDSTIKWRQNYSLYLRRFFLSFFPRAYLHKLNYLPKMFISACFSDKSVQMNYSAGKNHAIIYCYDA